MADDEVQEAEERWQATRRDTDGFRYLKLLKMREVEPAFYLQERVRIGDLSQERLELAAFLNHKAALEATGAEKTQLPQAPREWFRKLATRFGRREAVRALLALAQRVQPEDIAPAVAQQLERVEDYCTDPGRVRPETLTWEEDYAPQGSWPERAAHAAIEAAKLAVTVAGDEFPPGIYGAADTLFGILEDEGERSPEELVEYMWFDLRDWALQE